MSNQLGKMLVKGGMEVGMEVGMEGVGALAEGLFG